MGAGLEWAETLERSVPQELGDQINGLWRSTVPEHFCPGMRLNLGKFEVCVVGVHGMDLFTSRRTNHFDNFNQLIDIGLTRKDGGAKQHFSEHTAKRPNINRRRVISCSKYQLRGAIIAAADIRDVRLSLDKLLGAKKVMRERNSRGSV
jgi:hypothetical protein